MNPQQPYMPPNQGNPYDFIMNPAQMPKRSRNPLSGNKFLTRIALGLGSAFVVLIILVVLVALLATNKTNTADLVSLAQSQQEIIRIATLGTTDSNIQATRNLAVTTEYSVKSQQQIILARLNKLGKKVSSKDLTLKQDATVDQKFAAAKANSTYDQTYTQVVQDKLSAYSQQLQTMISKTPAGALHETLIDYNQQTQLLIAEVPFAQQDIQANS